MVAVANFWVFINQMVSLFYPKKVNKSYYFLIINNYFKLLILSYFPLKSFFITKIGASVEIIIQLVVINLVILTVNYFDIFPPNFNKKSIFI